MSASLILGRFFKKKTDKKPRRRKMMGTVAPENGMSQLINALVEKLTQKGVAIHYNKEVDIKSIPKPVVIATSAVSAGKLLSDLLGHSNGLENVDMLPLTKLAVGFSAVKKPLLGFGALFPRTSSFKVMGILSNTVIFKNRGPLYNETWILGGAFDRKICELSDLQLQEIVIKERNQILGDSTAPTDLYVTRWPQALPHYTLDLERTLESLEVPKDVYLTGNYLGGIGLSQILQRNRELAQRIANG